MHYLSRTELLRSYSGLLSCATPAYIPALLRCTFPHYSGVHSRATPVHTPVLLQSTTGLDRTPLDCYDRFSSPVRTENRDGSEVEEILTTAHREFGGCAHRCAGKPKRREQDRASPRRRGRARSGTAEGQLSESGNFCRVRARRWTPSCVRYMSRALLKARGCRREHRGRA